jgi:RHS repeat-associated protein
MVAAITTTGVSTANPTTTAKVTLINLHGDLVATATLPASGNAAGIDSWSDTTEYGDPRAGTTNPTDPGRYRWLGGKQRATDLSGLLLLGARVYNPSAGRFTSPDPYAGGNENAYNHPNDPVNQVDLDGCRCSWNGTFSWYRSGALYLNLNVATDWRILRYEGFMSAAGRGYSFAIQPIVGGAVARSAISVSRRFAQTISSDVRRFGTTITVILSLSVYGVSWWGPRSCHVFSSVRIRAGYAAYI